MGKKQPSLGPEIPLKVNSSPRYIQIALPTNNMSTEEIAMACNIALGQILSAFNCELISFPSFTAEGRVISTVQLRVKPE